MVETLPICLIVTIWGFMIVIEHVLKLQQSRNNKTQIIPGVWCCPLTAAIEKEEASRISEFEVSLVYTEFQIEPELHNQPGLHSGSFIYQFTLFCLKLQHFSD